MFCIIAVASLTSACSNGLERFDKGKPQVVAAPDKVSAMLANAADRAAKSLETMAAVEHHKSPGVAATPIYNAPRELKRAITINWIGPVEQIVQTLAERASYSYTVVGTAPPVPIITSVDVENKPIIEVLRTVGIQLGVRADIRVDSARSLIELHYPPNTGLGQEF